MNSKQIFLNFGEDLEIARQLVAANHVLVQRGVLDAFGHVSARSAADPDRFLISRNRAPALVELSDIQEMSLDCEPADERPRYLEAYIHAEIYRARPDVRAVVHSHSASVVPFSVVDMPLKPMLHIAGFLYPAAPVFEIRHLAGDHSDMLISDAAVGADLARTLGDSAVVLMRGHGSTAVGRNVPEAVFRAIYTEVAAKAQAEAVKLGAVVFLTAEEARSTTATNATQISRAWKYWCAEARTALANK
jgi:ribulose-5-phosphate 4-epimerase/fuculose-1-phosphate aldolase